MDSSSDSPDFTIRLILLALFLPVLLLAVCGLLYVRGITQLRRDLFLCSVPSVAALLLALLRVISPPPHSLSFPHLSTALPFLTPLPIALVHTPPSSTEDFSIIPPWTLHST
jgi:hypothetical protein